MVVDAAGRPAANGNLAGTALARTEVLGSPLEQEAYDVIDAVWLKDSRTKELVVG